MLIDSCESIPTHQDKNSLSHHNESPGGLDSGVTFLFSYYKRYCCRIKAWLLNARALADYAGAF